MLVSFGSDEKTERVIAAVQKDGTCWCGGTVWHGCAAMRISVCPGQPPRRMSRRAWPRSSVWLPSREIPQSRAVVVSWWSHCVTGKNTPLAAVALVTKISWSFRLSASPVPQTSRKVWCNGKRLGMTQIEQLASFVVNSSHDDLSAAAVQALKGRILDALGCALGALDAEMMRAPGCPTRRVRRREPLDADWRRSDGSRSGRAVQWSAGTLPGLQRQLSRPGRNVPSQRQPGRSAGRRRICGL